MMDRADIALLGIVGIIFLISILATRITLRRDGWAVQKYKLYKVRDQLIYLVATGKIREQDLIFTRFYKAVNCFIQEADRINHGNFVAAAAHARRKGIDPAEERNFQEICVALRKTGPEVNEVANAFYLTILEILIENSVLLRAIMKCSSITTVVKFLVVTLDPRPTSKSAFSLYDDYSRAVSAH